MKTRTRVTRKIVGSDYSAQEPRMTAFLADEYKDYDNPFYDETKEEKLDVDNLIFENTKKCHNKSRVAYDNGLDLYAMIAQSAYNNDYWDNMEFHRPGDIIQIDGKDVVCGNAKERNEIVSSDSSITIKYYELVETKSGDRAASEIVPGDYISSSEGWLQVKSVCTLDNNTTIFFE